MEKLRLFGKVDIYDPNKDQSNNSETVYIAGLSYDVSKEFMPFVAYERTDFEDPKKADTNMFQVGFQLKF